MAQHAEQVKQTQAAAKSTEKPQAATHKAATHNTASPKTANPDTPHHTAKTRADTDKPQKAADKAPARAADKSAKPADKAGDDKAVAQTDDTKSTDATTTKAGDDTQTADAATPAQADASAQTQTADADPAATAAVLVAQVQVNAQMQPLSQTSAPSADAEAADDAQLAAITPQAKPTPKAPPQSAPVAPEDAAKDAAPADDNVKSADVPPDTFAALVGQAAPVQAGATPAKTGKVVPSATDKPAAAIPAELTLKAGAPSDKAADVQAKLSDSQSADTSAGQSGDQKPTPFPVADNRDTAQIKVQSAPVQLTPQPVTPEQAAAVQAPPRAQDTTSTASAFSIQTTPADVTGSYSATGAQTASATTLSKASVETMSALGLQISKKLSEGVTKFAVELHPADLGKVEVSLNIGRDGKTTAHLRFDSPVTASAFSAHEGELRQQLANAGVTVDDGALSFSSRDGGGSGNSGQAFAQMFQGQEQASHGHAARALKTASDQADQVDADVALDAALADFRNRPANSTLALNLVV
jgi:hypothetical protein